MQNPFWHSSCLHSGLMDQNGHFEWTIVLSSTAYQLFPSGWRMLSGQCSECNCREYRPSANIYLYPLGVGGSKRLVFSGQLLQEGYLKTPISGFTRRWKMLFPDYWGYWIHHPSPGHSRFILTYQRTETVFNKGRLSIFLTLGFLNTLSREWCSRFQSNSGHCRGNSLVQRLQISAPWIIYWHKVSCQSASPC